MERMDGKVIVITGGSSGMGAAMAKDFVTRGAKVAIFDLNDEKGQNLIAETGEAAAYYKVDVTSKAEIEKGLTAVEEKFGPLTTLINSAGVSKMVPFLESSEALWDLTMNVNLKATFYAAKLLLNGCWSMEAEKFSTCPLYLGRRQVHGKRFIVLVNLVYKD